MNETIQRLADKTAWGEGPWLHEGCPGGADRVQWVDRATGLDCLAVRNLWVTGSWCGYVGVPPGHPAHGANYHDVDARVHGGLTFAGPCDEDPERVADLTQLMTRIGLVAVPDAPIELARICHVPEAGRPADVFWLGFDTAHAWDLSPGMRYTLRRVEVHWPVEMPEVYRDLRFVKKECRRLARQLARAAPPVAP